MTARKEQITVCICTYRRPHLLRRLLEELSRQETEGVFDFSIVVVDNDREESAKQVVTSFTLTSPIETSYLREPTPNIAMARNKAVKNAEGDYLAFIDDDEFPAKDWLLVMLSTCKVYGVAGVLGPVLPHFDAMPPRWLVKAGFYDRPRHETGFVLSWREARTGNVLIRRQVIEGMSEVFMPKFGTGGEDQDFFRRMMGAGHIFIWCDEAPAYETVPPHRWERRFLLKRALLRGHTTLRHPENRLTNLAKSLIAVPVYMLGLPIFLLVGHHHFMKYLVRLFDHAGRLLALLKLNPINERNN
jgi:glycosyltransferase involved in cell wall biosynthesis